MSAAPDTASPVGATPGAGPAALPASRRRIARGSLLDLLRCTLRVRGAQIGVVLLLPVVLIAVLGPFLSPEDPAAIIGTPYAPPGGDAIFGTDNLGRDVFSRFLHGGTVILLLSLLATLVGVGAGTLFGLIAGYRRGARAELIMRSLDVVLSFPPLLLALLFMSLLGAKLWLILLTVAISHAPPVARVVESSTLGVTGRSFVQYDEMIGVPRRRILSTAILPNVIAPLTVQFGLRLTYSIGLIAALAYLGFGRQPPAVDWGVMINENQAAIVGSPLPVVLPVLAIAILTIGVNLVTDGFGRAAGVNLGREDSA